MKKFTLIFFLNALITLCNASEINLSCTGIENFYSSLRGMDEKSNVSIEVKFDDETDKLLFVSPDHLFGCYEKNPEFKNKCNCKVTKSVIICEAEIEKPNFSSVQTISVNRYSGVLKFTEITNGVSGSDKYMMTKSGDLKCDSYSKRKF